MSEQKPTVLLLSLGNKPIYNLMCRGLIDALADCATVKRASTCKGAVRYLSNNTPDAVVCTDAAITHITMREAFNKLKAYVSDGGTAIFACHFGSFINPIFMDAFWLNGFNKPWRTGEKVRTTVQLNNPGAAKVKGNHERLATKFSTYSTFLKGVNEEDALYFTGVDSVVEANIWEGEGFVKIGTGVERAGQQVDRMQTPAALAKFESGYVGYVGDHNTGSDEGKEGPQGDCSIGLVLAMCGL